MWLLPAFSGLSRFAARTFYRLETAGVRVPRTGPVLLVANHPNSLLDPALVAAAASRPVRFLAKAPLFKDPKIGWLVRGAGSIPVYRRVDDPSAVGRNDEMFRAVHTALAEGSAVGIFPEGISHSEPSLAPLKTGAARIALGAAPSVGGAFPIVPVGLCYRSKERFRSEALILVGEPVAWDDLAGGVDGAGGVGASPEAVRELTRRIDAALREATINLEQWEDAPLVEWAQAIYAAEFQVDGTNGGAGAVDASGPGSRVGAAVGREPGGMGTSEPRGVPAAYDAPATRNAPAARIARVREAAETLARLRRSGDTSWTAVARDVSRHCRLLDQLRLQPDDLRATPRASAAVVWTLRQLAYFVVGAPLAAVGVATFYLPYRLTGIIEAASRPDLDRRSTYKALYGALLHLAWILALSAAAGWWLGWRVCIGAVVGLVLLGILTLSIRERWTDALANARRHLLLRGRRTLHERLRVRQREIAERLRALRAEVVDIVAEAAGDAAGPAVSARSTAPSSDGATASSMVGAPEQGVNR